MAPRRLHRLNPRRKHRPAHRQAYHPTHREVEVKLRVPDVHAMLQKLQNLGARYESRVLERNTLYDTPASDFRHRSALLRIRVETKAPRNSVRRSIRSHRAARPLRVILTHKAPAPPRRQPRYKEKLETELVVPGSPAHWDATLRSLGLRPAFLYEKFRTTFRLRWLPGLAIELDETPAGAFLELEGRPGAIDLAAKALRYTSRDYYRGTYWDVFAADCRRRGITPRNMVFEKQNFSPNRHSLLDKFFHCLY